MTTSKRVGVGYHKSGALTLSAMLPIICSILGEAQMTRISVKGRGLKSLRTPDLDNFEFQIQNITSDAMASMVT